MTHHLLKKFDLLLTLILLILIILIFYRGLTVFFFQDDFVNMYIGWIKNIEDLKTMLLSFEYYPYSAYRPIPYFIFGFFIINLFKLDPVVTHIAMYLIHLFNSYLLYKIGQRINLSKLQSSLSAFLYASSAIHIGALYWWSGHYVAIGTTFFLLSIIIYLKYIQYKSTKIFWLTIFLYIGMLLSNESLFLMPFVFLAIAKFKKANATLLLVFLSIISIFSFFFRKNISKFGELPDYTIGALSQILSTLKWYLLRIPNLPESIKSMPNEQKIIILVTFALMSFVIFLKIYKSKGNILKSKIIGLGLIIFFACSFPYFLLPYHLSSYYLSSGFIGVAFIIGHILGLRTHTINQYNILLTTFIFLWLLSVILNVQYINSTSWLVWRGEIARLYINKALTQYPSLPKGATVLFAKPKVPLGELKVALFGDKALRLYYNDKRLQVLYGSTNQKNNIFVISD